MIRLPPHEVHVWHVALDVSSAIAARLHATLSRDERERSARFRFVRDRHRFSAAHGALRELLGRYLATRPERIGFVRNAFGKPTLAPGFCDRLKFNLSHSGDLALIAVVADSEVGADLERLRPRPDDADVARCFFSIDELRQLNALPRSLHSAAFMRFWTRKEAYVKARGEGLAIPLNSFSVPLGAPTQGAVVCGRPWTFHTFQPDPGHVGTVAIEGSGWHFREQAYRASFSSAAPDSRITVQSAIGLAPKLS